MAAKAPRLILVIPCFNEEETLPVTAPLFAGNLAELVASGRVRAKAASFSSMTAAATGPGG